MLVNLPLVTVDVNVSHRVLDKRVTGWLTSSLFSQDEKPLSYHSIVGREKKKWKMKTWGVGWLCEIAGKVWETGLSKETSVGFNFNSFFLFSYGRLNLRMQTQCNWRSPKVSRTILLPNISQFTSHKYLMWLSFYI